MLYKVVGSICKAGIYKKKKKKEKQHHQNNIIILFQCNMSIETRNPPKHKEVKPLMTVASAERHCPMPIKTDQ